MMEPWSDNAVLLETSCGAILIDLFTLDAPEGATWIMDLVRSQVACGAIAVAATQHGTVLRLECPALPHPPPASMLAHCPFLFPEKEQALDSAAKRLVGSGMRKKLSSSSTPSSDIRTAERLRFSGRPGLVLLPRRASVEHRERQTLDALQPLGGSIGVLFCYVLLTAQNFDYLEADFAAVGQVREGLRTLSRMRSRCSRASQLLGSGTAALSITRPLRLIRVKQAVTLFHSDSYTPAAVALNNCAGQAADLSAVSAKRLVLVTPCLPGHSLQYRVQYNPHSHDGFLSSDDNDDDNSASSSNVAVNQELGAAQRTLHQRKLDETRSLMLNVLDGITDTGVVPPDTVLFVCKLNPLTTSEGLAVCFAQFGRVLSADVIRDPKGNSRCFAFVEFADKAACDRAYSKMDKALIDDCRIHVDYSQSVSKVWAASKVAKSSSGGGNSDGSRRRPRSS